MNKMNRTVIRFLAAASFGLFFGMSFDTVVQLVQFLDDPYFYFLAVYSLRYIALLPVTIGLLLNKPQISALGVIGIAAPISFIVGDVSVDLHEILLAVFFVTLFIACVDTKNGLVWGIISAITRILQMVLAAAYLEIFLSIGSVLLGFAFQNKSHTINRVAAADNDETIEKLVKLKHLLDEGIITKEEFEAKKKQLIDR